MTTAAPVDHLAGQGGLVHELLAGLTDEMLDQQARYYQDRWERTTGRAGYHYAKQLSAIAHEESRRRS